MSKLIRDKSELYQPGPNGDIGKSGVLREEQDALLQILQLLESEQEQVNYLEIGVFGGGTIYHLKKHTQKTAFFGIDLFEDFVPVQENTHAGDTFRQQDVQEFLGDEVILYKGFAEEIIPTLAPHFDLVFIDGDHSYEATLLDFRNADKILRGNGYIAFHNAGALNESDKWSDNRYVLDFDGGPWRVSEELKMDSSWEFVRKVERVPIFRRGLNCT